MTFLSRKRFFGDRTKTHWLKEGNLNTSYFHIIANGRLKINNIISINYEGEEICSQERLNEGFTDHHKQIFGSCAEHRAKLYWQSLYPVRNVNLHSLEVPFTERSCVFYEI